MERSARRKLEEQWLAVAVLAWVVGALLAAATQTSFRREWSAVLVGGIVSGATLGVLQWLVLRRHLRVGLWWIVATTAVVALPSYAAARVWPGGLVTACWPLFSPYQYTPTGGDYLAIGVGSAIVGALFGGVTGLLLGVGQWLVLRRASPRAGRWVAVNVLGLSVGFASGAIVLGCLGLALFHSSSGAATTLALTAGLGIRGAVSGAITGRALLRLL